LNNGELVNNYTARALPNGSNPELASCYLTAVHFVSTHVLVPADDIATTGTHVAFDIGSTARVNLGLAAMYFVTDLLLAADLNGARLATKDGSDYGASRLNRVNRLVNVGNGSAGRMRNSINDIDAHDDAYDATLHLSDVLGHSNHRFQCGCLPLRFGGQILGQVADQLIVEVQ
jgi:hypothetical protein